MDSKHGGPRWHGKVRLRGGWAVALLGVVLPGAVLPGAVLPGAVLLGAAGFAALGCESRRGETATATTVAGLQTAELHVQGTDCASCDVSIRRHLRQLEGVSDIRPGSDKQHVFVDFDPVKVSPEQIAKAVLEAGYEAEILVHSMAT